MTKEIEKNIKKITQDIAKKFDPEKIILFGSYVWGKPTKDSDIDLFIIKNTNTPRQYARKIDSSIFPRPFPIDFLISSPKRIKKRISLGDKFIKQIINNGRVLYEKQ